MLLEYDPIFSNKDYAVNEGENNYSFRNLKDLFLGQKNDDTKYSISWTMGKTVHCFVLGRLTEHPDLSRVLVAFGPRGNYGVLDTQGMKGLDQSKLRPRTLLGNMEVNGVDPVTGEVTLQFPDCQCILWQHEASIQEGVKSEPSGNPSPWFQKTVASPNFPGICLYNKRSFGRHVG